MFVDFGILYSSFANVFRVTFHGVFEGHGFNPGDNRMIRMIKNGNEENHT